MNFIEWLLRQEMTDVLSDRLDDVDFSETSYGFTYEFRVDGQRYIVYLDRDHQGEYSSVTDKIYAINLKGPQDYALTGSGRGPTVYRELLKAIRKLIEQENPDGLTFDGAVPAQSVMYKTFYERFLKRTFTKVSTYYYLRNDFIEQLAQRNPRMYAVVKSQIENMATHDPVDDQRQKKIAQRQEAVKKMQELKKYVGKILMLNGTMAYVSGINPQGFMVVLGDGQTTIAPFSYAIRTVGDVSMSPTKEKVEHLEWLLQSRGINNYSVLKLGEPLSAH